MGRGREGEWEEDELGGREGTGGIGKAYSGILVHKPVKL